MLQKGLIESIQHYGTLEDVERWFTVHDVTHTRPSSVKQIEWDWLPYELRLSSQEQEE